VAYSKNPNSRLIKDERNHFIKDQRCFEEELQRYQEINAIEDFNQGTKEFGKIEIEVFASRHHHHMGNYLSIEVPTFELEWNNLTWSLHSS
jgi:hypothetical protein